MSEELVRAEITRIDHLLSFSTEDSDLSYLSIEVEKLCKILQKLLQEVSKKFLPLLEEISYRVTKLAKSIEEKLRLISQDGEDFEKTRKANKSYSTLEDDD